MYPFTIFLLFLQLYFYFISFYLLYILFLFCINIFLWSFFYSRYARGSGFSGSSSGKEPDSQCRRHERLRFDPWVRKIPWRRAWQPTPVFLPGEFPWTEEPGGLQSIGWQNPTRLNQPSTHGELRACMLWRQKNKMRLVRVHFFAQI